MFEELSDITYSNIVDLIRKIEPRTSYIETLYDHTNEFITGTIVCYRHGGQLLSVHINLKDFTAEQKKLYLGNKKDIGCESSIQDYKHKGVTRIYFLKAKTYNPKPSYLF